MNDEDPLKDIPGAERAAILLLSIGEDKAAEVLKHMGAKDVQAIGSAMAALQGVSREKAELVLNDFVEKFDEQTSLGVGADDYVRNVLVNALGEGKAGGIIDRILLGRNTKGLEALKWMETRSIAEIIRNEHPQIIAIVLSYLDADQSAEILPLLPERTRVDVMMRIATLDGIQPAALKELDDIMERQFSGTDNIKSSSVGGLKVAANIMNFMEGSQEELIMGKIREFDTNLSENIEELMFVFDNLADLEDRDIQTLLREIKNEQLVLALKGAEPRVKDKILQNMSQRASEMLIDDMEAKGPVKVSEVERAQKEILAVARRLSEAGTISLGGSSEDYV